VVLSDRHHDVPVRRGRRPRRRELLNHDALGSDCGRDLDGESGATEEVGGVGLVEVKHVGNR
jgi:hypothetical protein